MVDIYAIKTDGLRYFVGQCPDEDDTVESVLALLTKGQGHRDTIRFELVRAVPPSANPGE